LTAQRGNISDKTSANDVISQHQANDTGHKSFSKTLIYKTKLHSQKLFMLERYKDEVSELMVTM